MDDWIFLEVKRLRNLLLFISVNYLLKLLLLIADVGKSGRVMHTDSKLLIVYLECLYLLTDCHHSVVYNRYSCELFKSDIFLTGYYHDIPEFVVHLLLHHGLPLVD